MGAVQVMVFMSNWLGVLLSTAGAGLPNGTRAGLCFKLLRVSPSDNLTCMMRHLQVFP